MVDGSRSDGVVKMSVFQKPFEKLVIDDSKTMQEATKRCAAWGYKSVEPFGGDQVECYNDSCSAQNITRSFQCIK